jgi:hypothetical protein
MCQEVLIPLWRVAGYGVVVNVNLNECAMACIVSKSRGSKSIKQSHKTPGQADWTELNKNCCQERQQTTYTSFCSPHLCCNLTASRVAKRRMGLCLGEKRNYQSVLAAVSLSPTKYIDTSKSIARPTIHSESPPWCCGICISTFFSTSAFEIRRSLT